VQRGEARSAHRPGRSLVLRVSAWRISALSGSVSSDDAVASELPKHWQIGCTGRGRGAGGPGSCAAAHIRHWPLGCLPGLDRYQPEKGCRSAKRMILKHAAI
jgi:hypothetical protein